MTQRIWILNSSLLGLAAFGLATSIAIRQIPPTFKKKFNNQSQEIQQKATLPLNVDTITQNDIFGLTSPTKPTAQMKSFNLALPAFNEPSAPQIPDLKANELSAPLNLTMSGIILSEDESKSIVMIIDESGKEKMCRIGEKFQDAIIVKISQNKVTLLRENGQQETFFLRKEENLANPAKNPDDRWKFVVSKKEDGAFILDPLLFVHEVPSVGELMDALGMIPSYKNNQLIGFKITKFSADSLASALGLQANDVITSINGTGLKDAQSRIAIYDDIVDGDAQKPITVTLLRDTNTLTTTYQRGKVPRVTNVGGVPVPIELRQSPEDETSQRRKAFENQQRPQRDETISEVRSRLLGNLRSRSHGRIR